MAKVDLTNATLMVSPQEVQIYSACLAYHNATRLVAGGGSSSNAVSAVVPSLPGSLTPEMCSEVFPRDTLVTNASSSALAISVMTITSFHADNITVLVDVNVTRPDLDALLAGRLGRGCFVMTRMLVCYRVQALGPHGVLCSAEICVAECMVVVPQKQGKHIVRSSHDRVACGCHTPCQYHNAVLHTGTYPPADLSNDGGGGSSRTAAIIGGVVAAAVGVLLLAVGLLMFLNRRARSRQHEKHLRGLQAKQVGGPRMGLG